MGSPVTASRIGRYSITIPGNAQNGGAGSTLFDLIKAAGFVPVDDRSAGASFLHGIRISAYTSTGGNREAFQVTSPRYTATGAAQTPSSSDFTHATYVPAGEEYYEPADGDVYSSVRGATVSPVTAQAIVYLI
jgi:hypothetical protein